MQRFHQVFGTKLFSVIGMIHVRALPGLFNLFIAIRNNDVEFLIEIFPTGTPKYDGNFNAIVEQARHEANIYKKHNVVSEFQPKVQPF